MSAAVALIQLRTPATQAAALAQAEPLVREAAAQGARLVVTPEGSNLLQRDKPKLFEALKPLEGDPFVLGIQALAAELGVQILIGSALVRREDGLCANRAAMIDAQGVIRATYDKIHMFDVDLPTGERHRESSVYVPGDRAVIAEAPFGPLGLTICYDVRFPHLYRALARAGAVAMAVPAAFTRPTGEAHWETLLRARAIETGAYVLAAAQGGTHEDGRATWGRSTVVDPWGQVLAKADHDEPCVVMAEVDPEAVTGARAAIPNLRNGRDFSGPERPA
jgi:predicted amidohydrolase